MKYILTTILLMGSLSHCHAQADAKAIVNKMASFKDQYGKNFNAGAVKDKLVIIYVPGGDDPLQKIYDKLKDKTISSSMPVQFVGGFGELNGEHGGGMTIGHLTSGFTSRYDAKYISILIDLQSEMGKLLNVKGLSVIIISKATNKIISSNDYGYERKKFFEAINQYIK